MQQCQNHWQAWHILQCAQSRRSGRKEENFREKSGKLRCRRGFARTQFKHAWCGVFCRARSGFSMTVWTCSLKETQRHSHTDTQRHAHSSSQALSVSGLQKSFPWPSSRTRACLYSASARSTVLSPGSFRRR